MQYILLIYENEKQWLGLSEADRGKIFEEYGAFTEGIVKSGQFRAGEALQPTSAATTVRVRNGKRRRFRKPSCSRPRPGRAPACRTTRGPG